MDISQYKDVYVFVEQRDGAVQSVGLELLGKARQLADTLNEKVVAILLGKNIADKAQGLIAAGADRVLVVDDDRLATYLTEPYAEAVSQIIREQSPSIFLLGATVIGRDLAPRVSARIGTGLTADCTQLEIGDKGELLMTRPAFGGNLMATILCKNHRPQMSTVRPGVMQKAAADGIRKGGSELRHRFRRREDFTRASGRRGQRVQVCSRYIGSQADSIGRIPRPADFSLIQADRKLFAVKRAKWILKAQRIWR